MKRILMVAMLMLSWGSATALAGDLLSTWKGGAGETLTLSIRDASTIRFDSAPDSYMLMTGKKIYMVAKEDGKWTAMDMDQMSGMMKMLGGGAKPSAEEKATYTKTARSETIAGYTGTVYIGETRDAAGKVTDSAEVVFSKAEDIIRINEAWMAMASAMGRIAGPELSRQLGEAAGQARTAGYGGFLRVGNDLTLTGVKKGALPGDHFSLPDGVELSEMPGLPAKEEAAGDTGAGSAVAGAAKETGKEIGGAATDEAKGATIDEVRGQVRGLFNKMFKND